MNPSTFDPRMSWRSWTTSTAARRLSLRPEIVAAWCDEVARRVRSGDSLGAALRNAGATDAALRVATEPLRHALDRGATVADAVATVDARIAVEKRPHAGLDHLTPATSVIRAAAAIGGSAAAPLDRVAGTLRLRAVDRDDRATHAAQARMSAHVLTVVPLMMLALLAVADADVRDALMGIAGATCVTVGLVLNGCGWWWMRRIVQVPR